MRISPRISVGFAAAALAALAVAVAAQGASDPKILVCHGTASDTNTYVLVEVSDNALNGHFDVQDGMVVGKGHGKQNAPDQWSPLDGSNFSGDCLTLYLETYGPGPE